MKKLSKQIEGLETLDEREKRNLASNHNTPVEVLKELYCHGNTLVNGILDCTEEEDDIFIVLAGNPNTPVEVLLDLAVEGRAISALAESPNTPAEVLLELVLHDHTGQGMDLVAENQNTPAEALVKLALMKDRFTKQSVAEHKNTLTETLNILSEQGGNVGKLATENLKNRF